MLFSRFKSVYLTEIRLQRMVCSQWSHDKTEGGVFLVKNGANCSPPNIDRNFSRNTQNLILNFTSFLLQVSTDFISYSQIKSGKPESAKPTL